MPSREEQVASYLSRVAGKSSVRRMIEETLSGGTEAAEAPGFADKRIAAKKGLGQIDRGRTPAPEQSAGLEAIILPKIRPVLDIVDGKFHTDHPLWLMLNHDQAVERQGLLAAIPAIGRIELPGHPDYPYGGTGFVVGENLVMTNRHVAAIFTSGIGTRQLSFKPGLGAGIDFLRELDRPTGPTLQVKRVKMVHPYWDMALLEVVGLPPAIKPLVLSQHDVSKDETIQVGAIGYPAFDTRNDAQVQNDLFHNVFGVKRLQPGTLGGLLKTESFGKSVDAVRHTCSTLGGNSGSALIALDSGKVVALHFGGRYRVINFGVPTIELAKDGRVVDAGVRFDGTPPNGEVPWSKWWARADETPDTKLTRTASVTPVTRDDMPPTSRSMAGQSFSDGTVRFVVLLHVTLRLGSGGPEVKLNVDSEGDSTDDVEGMVVPMA